MIKNMIFDWSGTLSDDIIPVYRAIMIVFEKFGASRISMEEFRKEFELPYMNFFKKYNIRITKEESDRIFHDVFDPTRAKPFPQAKKILEFFHKKGVKMAVLSSHPQEPLKRELMDYRFEKFFLDVAGGIHDKTKVIDEMIARNKFNPKETAYVGDMTHDIEAGKKVKVITIAVSWGYQSKEKLSKQKPDFLIENLSELKRIVS